MLGLAVIPVVGIIGYLPIVLAWSDRQQRDYPEFPGQEYASITPNAPMRWLSWVYDPLIRRHAESSGWSYYGVSKKLAYPEPDIVLLVCVRQKVPAARP